MEKRKPNYDLNKIKSLLSSEDTREVSGLSRRGAVSVGCMDAESMLSVIEKLTRKHFYKSMTVIGNSKIWQDVYKIADEDKSLYIKVQLSADRKKAVIVQFKEDEGGD
jgi:motility quorum-sensing regulator/GCU-specific mRNA interferase toxin